MVGKQKRLPKQFLHRASNEIFVANVIKISTFNKDVLDGSPKQNMQVRVVPSPFLSGEADANL